VVVRVPITERFSLQQCAHADPDIVTDCIGY